MIISWNAPSSSCMLELENDRLLLLSFPWCPRPLNQRIILLSSISWIYRLVQSLWCFNFLITTLRFLSTNICLSMSLLIMMIVLPNWVDLAVDNSHLRAGHDLQFSSVIDKCQPPGSGGLNLSIYRRLSRLFDIETSRTVAIGSRPMEIGLIPPRVALQVII